MQTTTSTAAPSPAVLSPPVPHDELWFRAHPRPALAVVALLFAGVLTLRLSVGDPVDGYSMLFVFPVALAAVTFGARGGLLAGAVGLALVAVWVVVRDVDLSVAGWVTRALPLLLLGYLLGRAVDRGQRAEAERRRLEVAAALHREAIEINDSLVQRMSAAKWALEAGRTDTGLEALAEAIGEAHRLVSDLIRRAEMGDHAVVLPGDGRA
jgi:glucose-6-phosphate-specific signal transduction histidine kinase